MRDCDRIAATYIPMLPYARSVGNTANKHLRFKFSPYTLVYHTISRGRVASSVVLVRRRWLAATALKCITGSQNSEIDSEMVSRFTQSLGNCQPTTPRALPSSLERLRLRFHMAFNGFATGFRTLTVRSRQHRCAVSNHPLCPRFTSAPAARCPYQALRDFELARIPRVRDIQRYTERNPERMQLVLEDVVKPLVSAAAES